MTRLSHFIRKYRQDILAAWETFARELRSGASMDVAALRDLADAMLDAIARDLEMAQTEQQRMDKAARRARAQSRPHRWRAPNGPPRSERLVHA